MFLDEVHTWYDAQEVCEKNNSYPAELIDVAERDAVFNYAKGNLARGIACLVYKKCCDNNREEVNNITKIYRFTTAGIVKNK